MSWQLLARPLPLLPLSEEELFLGGPPMRRNVKHSQTSQLAKLQCEAELPELKAESSWLTHRYMKRIKLFVLSN